MTRKVIKREGIASIASALPRNDTQGYQARTFAYVFDNAGSCSKCNDIQAESCGDVYIDIAEA